MFVLIIIVFCQKTNADFDFEDRNIPVYLDDQLKELVSRSSNI
jgi:hypothetical protein